MKLVFSEPMSLYALTEVPYLNDVNTLAYFRMLNGA